MANILIVEDERKTAELLREMIEKQSAYLVVHSCDSIEAAVTYLEKHQSKLDLLFLDIQLADGESFEIFEEIEVRVPVIFCTAFDEHVLKAFKKNGIDYILKPFQEADIAQALAKFEQLRQSFAPQTPPLHTAVERVAAARKSRSQTFLTRIGDKMIPVPSDEIAFVLFSHEIVYLYNFQGERFPIFRKMEDMEQALDKDRFFRINRQMIACHAAIRSIEPYFKRKLVLNFDFSLPEKAIVSRLKVTPFLEWMEGR